MSGPAMAAFVFLVGLTASGVCGSLMQIATGRTLCFAEPYVSRAWLARSLLATLAAGPMMLANEALLAWRQGRIGWVALLAASIVAGLWAGATGIVVLEIASRMGRPLLG